MVVRQVDVVLVGGGVMSVIFGMMFRQFDLFLDIVMVECFDYVVYESMDGWNNVGIGYVGYCELNYILEIDDGDVVIEWVLKINVQFEVLL